MGTTNAERKVLQHLYEAEATELAMVQTLKAHISMTPSGPYRGILERHLRETTDHAERVRGRMRAIERRRNLAELALHAGQLGVGAVQGLVGQAVATAKLPLELLRGGLQGEEKLLKNAKDECAGEALEIATYDAIEQLAQSVGDQPTARLAASIRAEEERFLDRLREQIPALTEAVVAAELGRGTYEVAETGAAQSARRAARTARRKEQGARKAAGDRSGRAAEAMVAAGREAASAGEATAREARRGAQRTGRELAKGAARTTGRARHAAATRGGPGPSAQAGQRREPWPGYDEQPVAEIAERLEHAETRTAAQVRGYESQHKDRAGVIQAAEKEIRQDESQAAGSQATEGQQEGDRSRP